MRSGRCEATVTSFNLHGPPINFTRRCKGGRNTIASHRRSPPLTPSHTSHLTPHLTSPHTTHCTALQSLALPAPQTPKPPKRYTVLRHLACIIIAPSTSGRRCRWCRPCLFCPARCPPSRSLFSLAALLSWLLSPAARPTTRFCTSPRRRPHASRPPPPPPLYSTLLLRGWASRSPPPLRSRLSPLNRRPLHSPQHRVLLQPCRLQLQCPLSRQGRRPAEATTAVTARLAVRCCFSSLSDSASSSPTCGMWLLSCFLVSFFFVLFFLSCFLSCFFCLVSLSFLLSFLLSLL